MKKKRFHNFNKYTGKCTTTQFCLAITAFDTDGSNKGKHVQHYDKLLKTTIEIFLTEKFQRYTGSPMILTMDDFSYCSLVHMLKFQERWSCLHFFQSCK